MGNYVFVIPASPKHSTWHHEGETKERRHKFYPGGVVFGKNVINMFVTARMEIEIPKC